MDTKSVLETSGELGAWSVEGNPHVIHYRLDVIESIRASAEAGYYRITHGGVEIGGILFGTRDGQEVHITAFRPVECEYSRGPSYRLSATDLERFQGTVDATAAEPALEGLEPVGWYHSHTRSEIFLSEEDLAISDKFFPDPGQVALVLRPSHFGPVRAGFFYREQDGSIAASKSAKEFVLSARRVRTANSGSHHQPDQTQGNPEAPASEPPSAVTARYLPAHFDGAAVPGPAPVSTAAPKRRNRWVSGFVLLLMLAAAAYAGYAGARVWLGRQESPPLALRVKDAAGQLMIEWDHTASAVVAGADAVIDIADGPDRSSLALDQSRLRKGRLTYARQTGKVEVRMRVRRSGHLVAEEYAQYLGSPTERAERQQITQQLEAMKTVLAEQSEEIRRLKGGPALPASKSQPVVPPAVAAARPATAPPQPAAVSGQRPLSGRLIWTGDLKKNDSVAIYGAYASVGRLTGELPGVPVRLSVSPARIAGDTLTVFAGAGGNAGPASEPPGPQNRNLRTITSADRKQSGGITVLASPATQNSWRAITLRNDRPALSAIVVYWEAIGK